MHVYEVLKRPIGTEKTDFLQDEDKYVFEVDRRANKIQIREAVQEVFGVTVLQVNVINVRPKTRRFGRRVFVSRPGWKKAIVTLAPGDRIEFFEGV
jgi:large subunit ribosomal protein L23